MNLSEKQRNILGVFVLLLVNIIWVLSSELTKHIFKNENYNKPFLSTYLKSSMFTIFLCGFLCSVKWRMLAFPHRYYSSSVFPRDNAETEIENEVDSLSEPIFVPIKLDNADDEELSKLDLPSVPSCHATDDDFIMVERQDVSDIAAGSPSLHQQRQQQTRQVKFRRYLEVRQLSETYAEESLAARMSYQASKRHKRRMIVRKILEHGLYPATTVLKLALQFCFCWFVASYSYQMGLSSALPSVVNVISSTSSLFTLVLASFFPSSEKDKFTVTKLVVVFISMGGVIMVSLADFDPKKQQFKYRGVLWSLLSAACYAIYLVSLRRRVKDETQLSLFMFFGFVGFWTVLCFWPGLFLLNWAELEPLQMPNRSQIGYLLLNGAIGTVGAELLWLWGCFLTSSLTATVSLGLTIPMSMIADFLFYKKVYDWKFYVGSVPILVSFGVISYLTRGGSGPTPDPIGGCLTRLWSVVCGRCSPGRRWGRAREELYEPLLQTESSSESDTESGTTFEYGDEAKLEINNSDLVK